MAKPRDAGTTTVAKANAAPRERLSHGQFAAVFNISPRAAKYMAREDGAPHDRDGWLWPEAASWFVRRETAKVKAAAKPTDLADAQVRQAIAEATLAELKVGRELDQLMTTGQFDTALAAAYERTDAVLKSLLPRLAPVALGIKTKPEALARFGSIIEEVRAELYAGDDVPEPVDAAVGGAAA